MITRLIILFLMLCMARPLAADDWLRAESDHFVVHAKLDEPKLRELVQLVENFDRLLGSQLPRKAPRGRKLHFFLDDNDRRISNVSEVTNIGFVRSLPEMAASFSLYDSTDDPLFRNYALFAGLAGYHLDNGFYRPNPVWVKAGASLFFATAYVDENGHFILGAPDIRRPLNGSLNAARVRVLLETVTTPRSTSSLYRLNTESRALMNPLLIEPSYAGLLENYVATYASGGSLAEAGALLGDYKALAEQINRARSSKRPTFRRVELPPGPPAEITVRQMSADEIALIQPRFRRLLEREREKAAKELLDLTTDYPDSSLVWYEYAAAEFSKVQASHFGEDNRFNGFGFSNGEILVIGNPYSDADAWKAVNRALELDPDNLEARRLKAEILMSRIVRDGDIDDAKGFGDVRALLAPLANDAERQPFAAALLHQSYIEEGTDPPVEVREQLGRAFVANPAVEAYRYAYAVSLSRHGQSEIAESLLTSMLNHPDYSEAAQRALGAAPL